MILIANPIYDTVFKRMMENDRVARFFIGTLLCEEVAAVSLMPQEFTYYSEQEKLTVFRLDFMATVVTSTGAQKKVLIEMQKAKVEIDLMRFRRYLGEQYKKSEMVNGVQIVLPIITIYILGFKLPEIPTACVRIGREYRDMLTDTLIMERSPFIERLTHDCYVVQVGRITERYRTRLDKLLSIFEQHNFVDADEAVKQYLYDPDDEDVRTITDILHYVGTDPVERKELDKEIEYRRTMDEYYAIVAEKDETIAADRKAIAEKDAIIAAEREALAKKDAALAEKDAALACALAELAALKKK
ncbi:MAG: hypothetical protein LBF55_06930 [Prevotellaceae bacterium]|jgi:hypothetical protein|nr:hypothetical protein [Prevotellaceae bacterium]